MFGQNGKERQEQEQQELIEVRESASEILDDLTRLAMKSKQWVDGDIELSSEEAEKLFVDMSNLAEELRLWMVRGERISCMEFVSVSTITLTMVLAGFRDSARDRVARARLMNLVRSLTSVLGESEGNEGETPEDGLPGFFGKPVDC